MLAAEFRRIEGLDLYGANKAVLYDPPWNESTARQAGGRINRPQQKLETEFIHLITAGTVEEKVCEPDRPLLADMNYLELSNTFFVYTCWKKMVAKQIYKGTLDRILLGGVGEGISFEIGKHSSFQKSLFDKDDLTKLFTLEPDGVCECLDKFKQKQDGAWTKKCTTRKDQHNAVIGISQRSKVYEDEEEGEDEDEDEDKNRDENKAENGSKSPPLQNDMEE